MPNEIYFLSIFFGVPIVVFVCAAPTVCEPQIKLIILFSSIFFSGRWVGILANSCPRFRDWWPNHDAIRFHFIILFSTIKISHLMLRLMAFSYNKMFRFFILSCSRLLVVCTFLAIKLLLKPFHLYFSILQLYHLNLIFGEFVIKCEAFFNYDSRTCVAAGRGKK